MSDHADEMDDLMTSIWTLRGELARARAADDGATAERVRAEIERAEHGLEAERSRRGQET